MECKVNLPYPEVKVEKENKEFAYLLLEDYAGRVSELSAITQYSYQHFLNAKLSQEYQETLANIAKVEMHHLELLGKTISLLGAEPKYISIAKTYWESSFVNYTTDLKEMLKNDIKIEEEAINNYLKHYNLISDKYIKELIKRIILDEEKHLECFCILLNKLN